MRIETVSDLFWRFLNWLTRYEPFESRNEAMKRLLGGETK